MFFLALFSSALAAPQYLPYTGYYHPYSAYPAYPAYQPASLLYYPSHQRLATNNVLTKSLINFGNFLQINGEFMADTTTTPARTISGTLNIQQNGILDVVTGQDAKFSLYIQSTADLNGKELKVQLGTGTDCTVAAAATGTDAPVVSVDITLSPSEFEGNPCMFRISPRPPPRLFLLTASTSPGSRRATTLTG